MTESLSWQFKVCLIGDGYVGKTSIRRKYIGKDLGLITSRPWELILPKRLLQLRKAVRAL